MSEPYLVENVTFTVENGIPIFTFTTQLEERLTNIFRNFHMFVVPVSTLILREFNRSPELVIPKDAVLRIEFSFDDLNPGVTLWDIYLNEKEATPLISANNASRTIAFVVKDRAGNVCFGPLHEKPYIFDWSGISGASAMGRLGYAMAGKEMPKSIADNFIQNMHGVLGERGYVTGMQTEIGRLHRNFNEYDKAIAAYIAEIKGSTRADGSFVQYAMIPFNNLAVVYKKQLQIEKAIDAFKVALSLNPNYFEALMSIAGCFFENMNQNIKYFGRAYRIRPNDALWNAAVHSYAQAYRIPPQTYFDKIQEEAQKVDISEKVAFDLEAFMRLRLPLD